MLAAFLIAVHEAVVQHGAGNIPDIILDYEGAAFYQGKGAQAFEEGDAAAGGGAEGDIRMAAGSPHDVAHRAEDLIVHMYLAGLILEAQDIIEAEHLVQGNEVLRDIQV